MKNSAYEIALNPQYDGYQRELASIIYTFFDKKTVSGATDKAREQILSKH